MSKPSPAGRSDPPLLPWIIGAALVVFGALLRLPGLFTDLHAGEVASLNDAASLSSVFGVFTELRRPGDHWLNTALLYLLGDQPGWISRLPAYFAGAAAVAFAWRASCALLRRDDALLEPTLSALLVAVAFPLVFYGSEAQGYGLLIAFTLLALDMLLRHDSTGRARYRIGYWIAATLGLLSHLVLATLVCGAALWGAIGGVTRRDRRREQLLLHAPPLAALAALCLNAGHAGLGDERAPALGKVVTQVASLSFGGPHTGPLASVAAFAAALALCGVLRMLRRRSDERWIVFAAAVIGLPGLIALASPAASVFPRYALVSVVLMQLALALGIGHALRAEGAVRKGAALILLVTLTVGHGVNLQRFWEQGRGHYREAVLEIAATSTADLVRISGNDPRRTKLLVDYQQRFVRQRALSFVPAPGPQGVEWWIEATADPKQDPLRSVTDSAGNHYLFERSYGTGPLSGVRWSVYRRK